MKGLQQAQAQQHRRQGRTFSEIARLLHVSKSTAYGWTKDTVLTSEENKLVQNNLTLHNAKSLDAMLQANRIKHEKLNAQLKVEARNIVANAPMGTNVKKLICATMFWCEGEKTVSSGVKFINADPVMMRTFMTLLRESFDIDETKFRALIHLHGYHDEQTQLKFWSQVTRIPTAQFHKSYIKAHTGKKIKEGYAGCLSLRYADAQLGKLLKMIYSELGKTT